MIDEIVIGLAAVFVSKDICDSKKDDIQEAKLLQHVHKYKLYPKNPRLDPPKRRGLDLCCWQGSFGSPNY